MSAVAVPTPPNSSVTISAGQGINGFDDLGAIDYKDSSGNGALGKITQLATKDGIVDDATESVTAPPYPVQLRGIQVKIRVFEPDSRQIREVTVVQDFLAQ